MQIHNNPIEMDGYSFLGPRSPRSHSLKVYITGTGYKTVTYEEDWTVQELCSTIAHKLHLPDEDLFGIFEVFGEPGVGKEMCIKDTEILQKKLDRSVIQGRQFVFKYKYLVQTKIAGAEDRAMDLYYLQTKENILSGHYHTPDSMATALAAIQMQIEFGPFNVKTHISGFLFPRLRDFLPLPLLVKTDPRVIESLVLQTYGQAKLVNFTQKSQSALKRDYLSMVMTLSVFGCRFFIARQNKVATFPKQFYLGVKSTESPRTFIQEWTFDTISRWGNKRDENDLQETLYIQLQSKGNHAKGMLWVIYTEAETVCELLDKYSTEMFKTLSEEGEDVSGKITEEKAAQKILACYRGYQVRKRLYDIYVHLNATQKPTSSQTT